MFAETAVGAMIWLTKATIAQERNTAKLIRISPDAVQGQTMSYYEIELELDSQIFSNGDMQYKLVPGVQVHVFILTGERTILSYVTTPFHNSIGQALQER